MVTFNLLMSCPLYEGGFPFHYSPLLTGVL
jgi:hypothetical protein